jgi:hypothetical protein
MTDVSRQRCLCALAALGLLVGADAAPRPTATLPPDPADWLLQDPTNASPVVLKQLDANTIELTNGLLSRVFAVSPFFATWDLADAHGSVLRGLSPEATLTLDGVTYDVGGAVAMKDDGRTVCPLPSGVGPPDNCPTAFFNRTVVYATNAAAFQYAGHWTSAPQAPFEWAPKRHAPATPWPPVGLVLNVNFTAPTTAASPLHKNIVATLHFEMLQGIPAMAKSMTVSFGGGGGATAGGDAPKVASRRQQQQQQQQQQQHKQLKDAPVAAADAARGVGVPPDQQGPICLQPCDVALPPSNWESKWILNGTTTAPQMIHLYGEDNLCLTVAPGESYHSFNDQLDAQPCNVSDSCQLWSFDAAAQTLQTAATAADLNRTLVKRDCLAAGYPKTICTVGALLVLRRRIIGTPCILVGGRARITPRHCRWRLLAVSLFVTVAAVGWR